MPSLLIRDEGSVRILTLNRPEVRNALNRALRDELAAALNDAEGDDSVRSLVLTGKSESFCAGMDLAELEGVLDRSPREHLEDSHELAELFMRIYAFPKPTVAAVNGHAIAGGAGLASLCDLVIMSEEAKLGYSEARIGFVAALVSVFLVRMCGERTARELLLLARPVAADEVLRHGLVSEVHPAGKVLERAKMVGAQLAENSPAAMAMTKRLLVESAGLELSPALELAARANAEARAGDDLHEGVRAFFEKRSPEWGTKRP